MAERDAEGDFRRTSAQATAPLDGSETMRRAIRAVTSSQLLVAKSSAGRERRRADQALVTLRREVEAYVRRRRAAGDRPERMVVALKAAVHDARMDGAPYEDGVLAEAVAVCWGIEEYYRRGQAAGAATG